MRRTLLMIDIRGKAYSWRLSQDWGDAFTPAGLGFHAGAKNTGSLAFSEVANSSIVARPW